MNNADKREPTNISKSKTVEEIGRFWDSHSLSDYWNETREASFEVRVDRRRRVTIEPEVYDEIEALAHRRGVSAETLVNLWLMERLMKGRKDQHELR